MNNPRRILPKITSGQWIKGALSLIVFVLSSQIFTLLLLLPPPPYERERRKLLKLLLWGYARFMVKTHFNISTKIVNEKGEKFREPAVMIANHQSIFDVPTTFMLSPKILIVTNDWARQPMFHFFIGKYFNFFSVNKGLEYYVVELQQWIEKGYMILVFPEGVRWGTGNIERFHKGAFYLAEKLGVDILPILLHGNGTINSDRLFYLKSGSFKVKILPRITPDSTSFGKTYQERTKKIMQWYRQEYQNADNWTTTKQ